MKTLVRGNFFWKTQKLPTTFDLKHRQILANNFHDNVFHHKLETCRRTEACIQKNKHNEFFEIIYLNHIFPNCLFEKQFFTLLSTKKSYCFARPKPGHPHKLIIRKMGSPGHGS